MFFKGVGVSGLGFGDLGFRVAGFRAVGWVGQEETCMIMHAT